MARILSEPKIVVATHNAGKAAEIRELLAPWGIELTSAGDLGLPVPDETEDSFEGNALLKAADWAETPDGRDFGMAMKKVQDLLDKMRAPEPRFARFVCCLALVWPDGGQEVVLGAAEGALTWPPRGDQGHGYDPVFIPDAAADGPNEDRRTFGEMSPEEKNVISHRADAFAKLVAMCLPPLPGSGVDA